MFSYTTTTAAALDETALRDVLEDQFGAHICQIARVRLEVVGGVGAPAGPRTAPEASPQLRFDLGTEAAAPIPAAPATLRSSKAIAAGILFQLRGKSHLDKQSLFQLSGALHRPTFQKALDGLLLGGEILRVGRGLFALPVQETDRQPDETSVVDLLEMPEVHTPMPRPADAPRPQLRLVSSSGSRLTS